MRKIALIIILVAGMATHAEAQKKRGIYRTKYEKLVDLDGHNRLSGFHFAPGATYTLTRFHNKEEELYRSNDTVLNGTIDPKGRLGFYLEAGMYHLFRYGRIFHYLDWSIAWKNLSGAQQSTTTLMTESNQNILAQADSKGRFKHHYLLANVNLNNVKQVGNYSFIQNTIGLNADYGIIQRQDNPVGYGTSYDPAKFLLQLHYKIGFGYKFNDNWFIIPALETPILSLVRFEKGKSTLGVMNSRYRPLILTVRFAWLRQPKRSGCPAVEGAPGDKQRQQNYQMSK